MQPRRRRPATAPLVPPHVAPHPSPYVAPYASTDPTAASAVASGAGIGATSEEDDASAQGSSISVSRAACIGFSLRKRGTIRALGKDFFLKKFAPATRQNCNDCYNKPYTPGGGYAPCYPPSAGAIGISNSVGATSVTGMTPILRVIARSSGPPSAAGVTTDVTGTGGT